MTDKDKLHMYELRPDEAGDGSEWVLEEIAGNDFTFVGPDGEKMTLTFTENASRSPIGTRVRLEWVTLE
jgi:hypothetical protein